LTKFIKNMTLHYFDKNGTVFIDSMMNGNYINFIVMFSFFKYHFINIIIVIL